MLNVSENAERENQRISSAFVEGKGLGSVAHPEVHPHLLGVFGVGNDEVFFTPIVQGLGRIFDRDGRTDAHSHSFTHSSNVT